MKIYFIVIFLLLSLKGISQNEYERYKSAYEYIDSIYGKQYNERILSISEQIKFFTPLVFKRQLMDMRVNVPSIVKNSDVYEKRYYFATYHDKKLNSLYKIVEVPKKRIVFSKPFENTLIVQVRNFVAENIDVDNEVIYGEVRFYLFVFNSVGQIISVLSEDAIFN